MLKDTRTQERLSRHHITQEDFTPDEMVASMYSYFPDDVYADFSKTILDPCFGNGNLLLYVIKKRLIYCSDFNDIINALSTVYGTELMDDNVDECHSRIMSGVVDYCHDNGITCDECKIKKIIETNIVCADAQNWSYELWCPVTAALF